MKVFQPFWANLVPVAPLFNILNLIYIIRKLMFEKYVDF